jgi:hypothetical protein
MDTNEVNQAFSYSRTASGATDIVVAAPITPASEYADETALDGVANAVYLRMGPVGNRAIRSNIALVGNGADGTVVRADLYAVFPGMHLGGARRLITSIIGTMTATLRGGAVAMGRSNHWYAKTVTVSDSGLLGGLTADMSKLRAAPSSLTAGFAFASIADVASAIGVLVCPALGGSSAATGVDVMHQLWR